MRKNAYSDLEHTRGDDKQPPVDSQLAHDRLPNRLMTAFEVAEFVGCREETIRSAICRVLEKPSETLRFKAEYRRGHQIATVNRALSTLRAAINWGRFQDPPVLSTSPFHRFGVNIKTKEETKRDRRVGLQEERALLTAAVEMSSAEHKFVGSSMHDRLIGALETCCRQGEMLRIQNRHVDWDQHQIAIPCWRTASTSAPSS